MFELSDELVWPGFGMESGLKTQLILRTILKNQPVVQYAVRSVRIYFASVNTQQYMTLLIASQYGMLPPSVMPLPSITSPTRVEVLMETAEMDVMFI